MKNISILICVSLLSYSAVNPLAGDVVNVVNAGFEDTSGQTVFNEFTFGTPNGWQIYDPNNITGSPGVFTGTLEPNGVDFFDSVAPEGIKVAILFNSSREGDGEYGYEQTLADVLQPNTRYELSVEVGNIGSGFASNGTFFDLSEFPGYRVELLAGGTVIAQDNNSLSIPEQQWDTSVVEYTSGASDALIGQPLGIRLVNMNVIPFGFTQATSPDLEVDFDDIRLNSAAVPEPGSASILVLGLLTVLGSRRYRRV